MRAPSIQPDPAPVVEIRPATLADLDALVALEHAAFASDRAERRAIRHAIRSASMSLLVALTHDAAGQATLVGSATLERRRGSRSARLSSIAVSPARAGLGLGSLVLDAAEADARSHGCARLRLEVRADNGAGIRLYERRGYTRFAAIPDYYEDGMEAWRYEKIL
ncbi:MULTISPECIES: N-acetyltransferase [unclassified Methylobacterium]|uniref:GNAT family N-acetyltransferase n=1 Tax=unclassified Methylobacterium TaxID=2615210 RepID=UPI0006F9E8EE|nr:MULTISPECIES: N-acetyltransferase [unclassified Methylobacterium]KQO67123.1 GCN5 family acetyltransferase [Methylobacterium sp. Leaf89]KQO74312.1 GCN5 family acetyltransferase [Methylobacterium sp. Leaf88]KQT84595.1 GCN5 family acetyltransferase [Methylobacterium sp. Leaf465]